MGNKEESVDSLKKELAYYKKQLDRLSGTTVSNQYDFAQLSNISKKYISGFKIIADLQRNFSFYTRKEVLFEEFMDGIFSHLFLDKVVLMEIMVGKKMKTISSRGYSANDNTIVKEVVLIVPDEFLEHKKSFLVSSSSTLSDFEKSLQENLLSQNFILIPLVKNQQVWGTLFVGMNNVLKPLSYLTFSTSNIDMFESLAGIISAMSLQLEHREIMEKERNRIARDMHDDLGSELSKISVTCGSLKNKFAEDKGLIKELEVIKVSTEEIVNNIGNIIWALNPVNNTTENLLAYIREYAYDFLSLHHINISFSFPVEVDILTIAHEIRTHIFMVIKEGLYNIVKHAKALNVTLTIQIEGKKLYCIIADDGSGINEIHKNNFGNGLRNMQQRMAEIGGELSIQSHPEKGTFVKINVLI